MQAYCYVIHLRFIWFEDCICSCNKLCDGRVWMCRLATFTAPFLTSVTSVRSLFPLYLSLSLFLPVSLSCRLSVFFSLSLPHHFSPLSLVSTKWFGMVNELLLAVRDMTLYEITGKGERSHTFLATNLYLVSLNLGSFPNSSYSEFDQFTTNM